MASRQAEMRVGNSVSRLMFVSVLLLLQMHQHFQMAACSPYAVSDKCAACQAVAAELEGKLANERPRNHIDMRFRLGSKGEREGKVIEYIFSELRTIELLDGLCDGMKKYTLETRSGTEKWVKKEAVEGLPDFDRQAAEAHSKAILNFCGRLVETTDDELTKRLMEGGVTVGQVEKILCSTLTKHCTTPSSVESDEDLDKDEL